MFRKMFAIGVVVAAVLAPAVASAGTGYLRSPTKLRAGPDTGYPTVLVVRRNEMLDIHGCLPSHSWCDVGIHGERGWLPANAILTDSIRGRIPVATYNEGIPTGRFNLDEYWDTNYHGRFDRRRGHWQSYWHDRDRDGTPDRLDDHPRNPNRD